MADPNFFPGFEGDDGAKKPQPAAKPAAPAKPAFDPFAGVPVNTTVPVETPAIKPATGQAAKPSVQPPAPAPSSDADADLKPGSRKDLWKCPHCGTGNKPDRTTCRSCGKSPDEPVVVPWFKNNLIVGGLAGAVILLLVVIYVATRADLSLRAPDLAHVDAKKARIGGSSSTIVDLGNGMRFDGEQRISVCGRVAAVGPGPGGTLLVALALGKAAADELPTATLVDGSFEVDGVVLACTSEGSFKPKAGQILSLTGSVGVLVKEGKNFACPPGVIPVAIDEYKTSP